MGAVLAGGESRRMGRDKAWVEFEGRPLLARAVDTLSSVFERVVIVGPSDRGYQQLGVEVVPDVRPGLGPVGGIVTALRVARGASVFILACDLPRVPADLIRWLIDGDRETPPAADPDRRATGVPARVVHDGRRPQPLCGLYRRECLAVAEQAIAAGQLSAAGLLESLAADALGLDRNLDWYRPDLLENVNDPGALGPAGGFFPARATRRVTVERAEREAIRATSDLVEIEEPLEIRVVCEEDGRRRTRSLAVTMRTPGQDFELAAGFLHGEGVVRHPGDIWRLAHCPQGEPGTEENVVDVHLAPNVDFDLERLSRHVMVSSACGICGRSSIEALRQLCPVSPRGQIRVRVETLFGLKARLADRQPGFSRTGGLHAAALCDERGEILELREDVGRHNALDKLVGHLLMQGELPATDRLLLLSGRVSYELVQKSVLAGIPVVAAIGAPSSLAIDLAAAYDLTLIGFLGEDRCNVYTVPERVSPLRAS